MKPAVGLGDVIRAVAQLAPHGDDPHAIARVLGLAAHEERVAVKAAAPAAEVPRVVNVAGTIVSSSSVTATVTAGAAPAGFDTPAATPLRGPPVLRPLGRQAAPEPEWLPAPGKGLTLSKPIANVAPPLETLFEPRRHRALIGAALATLAADGPLDLERLIDRVATRTLDRQLPCQQRPSLHRGAWLLLDRTSAMAPFFDDTADLADRIARVVGREVTSVQEFSDSPLRIWDTDLLEDRAIALPPPGTPLVAISDLGARKPERGWRELLLHLKTRGCAAIAITPYPVERCPAELRPLVIVVPWDRATKVGAVKARVRRAL